MDTNQFFEALDNLGVNQNRVQEASIAKQEAELALVQRTVMACAKILKLYEQGLKERGYRTECFVNTYYMRWVLYDKEGNYLEIGISHYESQDFFSYGVQDTKHDKRKSHRLTEHFDPIWFHELTKSAIFDFVKQS